MKCIKVEVTTILTACKNISSFIWIYMLAYNFYGTLLLVKLWHYMSYCKIIQVYKYFFFFRIILF